MNVKQITVSYSRKVSTGAYENADILVSETADLGMTEDPTGAERLLFNRLKASVDEWADAIRG